MDLDEIPQSSALKEAGDTEQAASAATAPVHSIHDSASDTHSTPQQGQDSCTQMQAESSGGWEDWQSGTYHLFECRFDLSTRENDNGIVKSYTTGEAFNSTVGQSRLQMGIRGDDQKMTNGRENNFFKALKWSPDGTCLLSSSNDNFLRIFALPDATTTTPEDTPLSAGCVIKEGEVVYDMCWYPGMNSADPATCCVLSSSRDHPIHLWDAYSGELRCSYTVTDHCDVNVAPTALCFNLDGSKIYCGSNNMIEIFDTTRPGRDSLKRPTVPTRKSRKGQKGVISCLAFNPDHSDLYAAGSYLKTIGLYDARADELLMLLRDRGSPFSSSTSNATKTTTTITTNNKETETGTRRQKTDMGGVTQLQFSHDGQYLYSASRQDSWIRCWDIRNTAQVLYRLERPGEVTNQRIGFDVSYDGRWLSTGDMNGDISVFDLSCPQDPQVERLKARIRGHDDVVSAAMFHPSGAILATCSGQRKYDLALDSSSSSGSDSSDSSDSEDDGEKMGNGVFKGLSGASKAVVNVVENSVRLWSLPGESVWYVNGQRWGESGMGATDTADPSPLAGSSDVDGTQKDSTPVGAAPVEAQDQGT
ncbi:WD40-repeat-containing domain protein [Gamsiella multidivaricata]|uniref:WD40-repeat-containing domain protein n=1 Tax=Gamsiella multidivaricata TaxID=101098 RepID=UPI002221083A|nr:WD40-repeat-containing domain protein [Gamsiella multidivaricata]KAI7827182.1 WD40-repeat-containing domain protein [Gamsiella multidivaricata]